MKRSKGIISKCLILFLVFSCVLGNVCRISYADTVPTGEAAEKGEYVDGLFEKLSGPYIEDAERTDINDELLGYGYEKSVSGNVIWYKNSITVAYGGTDYVVETFRAIPKNEKSNLACQGETSKKSKNRETYYRYDIQTNIIFKFVKEKGTEEDAKLSLIANTVMGHLSTASNVIRYTGISYTSENSNDERVIGIWKETYSDIDAIRYYLGESSRKDFFCDTVMVKDLNGQTVIAYAPLAPVVTAQVY